MKQISIHSLVALVLVSTSSYGQSEPGTSQDLPAGVSAGDWSSIRAAYESERHSGRPTESGFEAFNPGQNWLTTFDGRGFVTTPKSGSWSWGLSLQSYGFADSERELTEPRCMDAEGQRVWADWDGQLEEWYINDGRGLEHGYTLQERPTVPSAEPSGALRFLLAVRGTLTPLVHADSRGVSFLDEQNNAAVTYSGLTVFDADGRELEASIAREGDGLLIKIQEQDARYPLTIDPIAQQVYLKASPPGDGDAFGTSIAISGNIAVVGAPNEESSSVGVNGNQSNNSLVRAGAAYVFVRAGSTWSQEAYLKASNTGLADDFGHAVAVSGDTVVVGAVYEGSGATGVDGDQSNNDLVRAGAAYVFVRVGTTWSQQAYLKASNTDAEDRFGRSVTVSGDTVVVGASGEDSKSIGIDGDQSGNGGDGSGAAYVFVRVGTTWSQQAYLKASNTDARDSFGYSVSISGNTVLVGAFSEDSSATGVNGSQTSNTTIGSGAAYVFVRSGTTWSQQAYLKASNPGFSDWFGWSVGVSDDTAVVGAKLENSISSGVNSVPTAGGLDIGAAYIFHRTGTTWSQQAYLKASNSDIGDQFGSSVSVSGDTVVVGAHREDSNATGVNGDQAFNLTYWSGAAYVFVRTNTTWRQEAYLKASNTETQDEFGYSVAVDGNTVLVGARYEDGGAAGVNGDQSATYLYRAGAAYLFMISPSAGPSLCSGDGGSQMGCTECPCGNNAPIDSGGGCLNSSGNGARLDSSGSTSVSLNAGDTTDLRFEVSGAPPTALCFLNSGDAVAPDNLANPCFGLSSGTQAIALDGLRCAIANTRRHGARSTDLGGRVGATNSPWGGEGGPRAGFANAGAGFVSGQTRYFQVIHRDDPLVVCARGLNTSQAVEITFNP